MLASTGRCNVKRSIAGKRVALRDSLPRAVIFDMDGVLVDSNPFHLQKWIGLLEENGIPYDEATLTRRIVGHGNHDLFRVFFSDLTRWQILRMEESMEEGFRKAFQSHAKPLPGLVPLLDDLRRAGFPLAVASAAVRENVDFVLKTLRLGSYFPHTTTGNDSPHAKPHPGIYLITAEKLGVAPEDCVTFEDSFVGIEAANRAGMKCVAVASTFDRKALQTDSRADRVIDGFEQIGVDDLEGLFTPSGY